MCPSHRQHSLDSGKVTFAKGKAGTSTKFTQMGWRSRPRNGDHIVLLVQQPGDGQTGSTDTQIGRQITEGLCQSKDFLQVNFLKARDFHKKPNRCRFCGVMLLVCQ